MDRHPKCVTDIDVDGVRLSFDPPIGIWAAMSQAERYRRDGTYIRDYRTGDLVKA